MFFISSNKAEKYFTNKKNLGFGMEGVCYQLNETQVAKLYYCTDWKNLWNRKELLQFKDINVASFVFIQALIYSPTKIIGAISRYVEGQNLSKQALCTTPIQDICIALNDLIVDCQRLAALGIKVGFDIREENTIYHNKRFAFIDTSDYFFSNHHPDLIFKNNVWTIVNMILNTLFYHPNYLSNLLLYLANSKSFSKWSEDIDILKNPSLFLLALQKELEEYCEMPITAFADANLVLQRKMPY